MPYLFFVFFGQKYSKAKSLGLLRRTYWQYLCKKLSNVPNLCIYIFILLGESSLYKAYRQMSYAKFTSHSQSAMNTHTQNSIKYIYI